MSNSLLIKNGSTFPVPGKGVGLLFWLIVYVFFDRDGFRILYNPLMYFSFIFGFFLIFSRQYLEIVNINKGTFKLKNGFGKLSYGKLRFLSDYEYGIVQQGVFVQKVKQGIRGFIINEGIIKERNIILYLYSKKYKTKSLLHKGKKETIKFLVKEFLSKNNITTFNGGKKKGREIKYN